MRGNCDECGALLERGKACRDLLDTLLLFENELRATVARHGSERLKVAHFYAVGSYVLQHPRAMGYTADGLLRVRASLADQLAGRATIMELRDRAGRLAEGPARIIRREDDNVPTWTVDSWPMTAADAVAAGKENYEQSVQAWAQSVIQTLGETGV